MKELVKPAALTMLYVAVLLTTYWLHVRFFTVNVVLFSAVQDAFIAAFITMILARICGWLRGINRREMFLLGMVWILGGYAFAISVPTVLDRSLSFYILEKLHQRGGGIQEDRMKDVFTNEYMKEHRLVDIRLTEQLQSGTIEISNGCVKLTAKGESFAELSRYFRLNLLPKKRLIMGKYSDDLTDPFRNSTQKVDYLCQ